MPKHEGDLTDPLELIGVELPASTGSLDAMAEVFAEEFLRMGYTPEQVLDLFRDPFYRSPNLVYVTRGEEVVRAIIARREFEVAR